MPTRIVQSKQNTRLKDLRRALAEPGRQGQGMVGIEGPNLVEEALRAGLEVASIFAGERMRNWVDSLDLPRAAEVLIAPSGLLQSVLNTDTPQPVAALIRPPDWTWAQLTGPSRESSRPLVLLAAIQDPGNLGTIVRSAEAFGAAGIVCLPGTVHAWNPKAVRASAGSIFRMPLVALSEEHAFRRIRETGAKILAAQAQGAPSAAEVDLTGTVALMIGNEGHGIASDLVEKADGSVSVPCPGPVESLNAAVAASILLYEAARQRAKRNGASRRIRGAGQ